MYAGTTHCGWAKGMWPGGGGLYRWEHNTPVPLWVSSSGVALNRGQFIGTSSRPLIGGFCHESGHSVCHWPDLYDYDYDSEGIGRYCLMANFASSLNPVEPCAYLKYSAGWGTVTTLTAPEQGLVVPTSSTNTMFKYEHPFLSNEYFLIENRQQVDRDAQIRDNGLAVWHIDTNGSNSWNQMLPDRHFLVTLVQADGRWDMEMNVNEGDSTDLYGAPMATELTSTTNPSSTWWDGSQSGLWIENISESRPSMTFDVGINLFTTMSVADVSTVERNEAIWVFRVELANSGSNDAYNVAATITGDVPGVAVRKASCKYGDVQVGGNARPRGVYLLASDLKSWPGAPFSIDLCVWSENRWGSEFEDTMTLVFHPSADISCAVENVAVADPHQKSDRGLFLNSMKQDATEVGVNAGAYPTCVEGNHPNPFNPSTTMPFTLAKQERVVLEIYDAGGRLIRDLMNDVIPAGRHDATWDGRDNAGNQAATGVYFVRFTAGNFETTRKVVLIK
jgi:hypothetical protein